MKQIGVMKDLEFADMNSIFIPPEVKHSQRFSLREASLWWIGIVYHYMLLGRLPIVNGGDGYWQIFYKSEEVVSVDSKVFIGNLITESLEARMNWPEMVDSRLFDLRGNSKGMQWNSTFRKNLDVVNSEFALNRRIVNENLEVYPGTPGK